MSIVGTWLVVIGLIIASWQIKELHGKEIVTGKVTAVEPYGAGGRGGQTYRVVATFPGQDGQLHTYRAAFGLPSTGYEVGDPIRIYFDPTNAADCGVVSFGYRFGVAWVLIVLGLACWLLTGGWQLGNAWLDSLWATAAPAPPNC